MKLLIFALCILAVEAHPSDGRMLVQVALGVRRSVNGPSFFSDAAVAEDGSSSGVSVGEAASMGNRRYPISDLEVVHQVSAGAGSPSKASLLQGSPSDSATSAAAEVAQPSHWEKDFHLQEARETASRVLSLVSAGAQAAAENALPSLVHLRSSALQPSSLQKGVAASQMKRPKESPGAMGFFSEIPRHPESKLGSAVPPALAALQQAAGSTKLAKKVVKKPTKVKLTSRESALEEVKRASELADEQKEALQEETERRLEDSMDSVREHPDSW